MRRRLGFGKRSLAWWLLSAATALVPDSTSLAQDGVLDVRQIITDPRNQSLSGVVALGDSSVVAVGSGGAIARSNDRGARWSFSKYGRVIELNSIARFANAVVAVGDSGAILRSIDSGRTWNEQSSQTSAVLRQIATGDGEHGIVLTDDSAVLLTSDAGRTWLPPVTLLGEVMHVAQSGDSWTVAVGRGGYIASSNDFGATWVDTVIDAGQDFVRVHILDGQRALAIGAVNRVFLTEDRGVSWQERPLPSFQAIGHMGISGFFDDTTGFVTYWEEGAQLLQLASYTFDGGRTWQPVNGVTFAQAGRGFAAYDDASGGVVVGRTVTHRTSDRGQRWRATIYASPRAYTDVHFASPSHGASVGSYRSLSGIVFFVERTTDGGNSWTASDLLTTSDDSEWLGSVHCPDTNTIISVGAYGRVWRSSDFGREWRVTELGESVWLHDIDFDKAGNGIVVGFPGFVAMTRDRGSTWATTTFPSSFRVGSCAVVDSATALAIPDGNGLEVYRTTDAGTTWLGQSLGAVGGGVSGHGRFQWVYGGTDPGDSGTALAVLLRSSDGGATWSTIGTLPDSLPRLSWFEADHAGSGVALDLGNRLYRTTDAGGSWNIYRSGVDSDFERAAARSDDSWILLSEAQHIYRASISIPASVREQGQPVESPQEQSWLALLPGATSVRVHVPVTQVIVARVMDVLGRQVAAVDVGSLSSGDHDIELPLPGQHAVYFVQFLGNGHPIDACLIRPR